MSVDTIPLSKTLSQYRNCQFKFARVFKSLYSTHYYFLIFINLSKISSYILFICSCFSVSGYWSLYSKSVWVTIRSVCLYLSLFYCLSLYVVSLCLSDSDCLSRSVWISFCLSLCLSDSICLSLPVCIFIFICLNLYLLYTVCLYMSRVLICLSL